MKRAICLGTNYEGSSSELRWCVKDASDLAVFLKINGFETETLLDSLVNSSTFLNSLYSLCNAARLGDIDGLVFTHSGHGTRVYNHAEDDYYDEALYFLDGIVVDDEIKSIVDMIPDGFPNLIFLDTCHSGGMMRLISNKRIRYYPPEFIIPDAKLRKSICKEVVGNENYISACKSSEYSYDADALRNGAATHYLLKTFQQDNSLLTWYTKLRTYLPSSNYPQTPQLACKEENKEKSFFKWFNPISTGIEDIPETSEPQIETVKMTFIQKVWYWIRKILGL